MTYIVCYETENYIRVTTIGHGGLTAFKNLVKRVGWQIHKIETVDYTGRVIRTEKYVDNKRTIVYEY